MSCSQYLLLLFYVILSLLPVSARGQSFGFKNNEINLNEGVLSTDQIRGIASVNGNLGPYMSFPDVLTGAAFLTYRHYFSRKFALGVTFGVDNQYGFLSYGNQDNSPFISVGTTGTYKRLVYTGAVEGVYSYYRKKKFTTYGSIGFGYTVLMLQSRFNKGITDPQFFYGLPGSLVPSNPYTSYLNHFNAQVTPLGVRYGGDLAGFLEFGGGYKGIISGGLSYRFNADKRKTHEAPPRGRILFVPRGYEKDTSLIYMGKVKTGSPVMDPHARFDDQLDFVAQKTLERKANVFEITDLNTTERNKYNIKGEAYYTPHFDSLTAAVERKKKQLFSGENCAYVVIYHTGYNHSINSFWKARISVNNDLDLKMRKNSVTVLKVTREGNYIVGKRNGSQGVDLDVKFGHTYYVRTEIDKPGSNIGTVLFWYIALFAHKTSIEQVDEFQGEMESSVISDVRHMDYR